MDRRSILLFHAQGIKPDMEYEYVVLADDTTPCIYDRREVAHRKESDKWESFQSLSHVWLLDCARRGENSRFEKPVQFSTSSSDDR